MYTEKKKKKKKNNIAHIRQSICRLILQLQTSSSGSPIARVLLHINALLLLLFAQNGFHVMSFLLKSNE